MSEANVNGSITYGVVRNVGVSRHHLGVSGGVDTHAAIGGEKCR